MRKKIIAALLLAALILVPAGLAGATGTDDPVISEPEPGAGHDEGDVDATPEPVLEDEEEPVEKIYERIPFTIDLLISDDFGL